MLSAFRWLLAARRRAPRLSSRPRLEALEDRVLPAVNVFLSGRTLVAQGDDRGNVIQFVNGSFSSILAGVLVNNSLFDSVVINSGNGNDAVRIDSTSKPIAVNLGGGTDTVDIGTPINVLDLRAPININGTQGGLKSLVYDDQANGTPTLTYTLSTGKVQRNGLADVTYSGLTNVTVNTATAGNQVVNVLSTGLNQTTTVHGGKGNDRFFVGDANNTLEALGRLVIEGGGGQDGLVIRDMGTTLPAAYGITPTFITRPLGGTDAIQYSNISTLVVAGGSGGNTFTVDPGVTARTTIAAGPGHDTVRVANPQEQVPDGLSLTVLGGGNTQVFFDDSLSPAAHSYSLTGTGLVRDGGKVSVTTSGVAAFSLLTGTGGNTTNVANLGTMAATILADGQDAITVFGFQQAAVMVSDSSHKASLRVDDSGFSLPQAYMVRAAFLSASSFPTPIIYSGLASLRLDTASRSKTGQALVSVVDVNNTSAATTIAAGADSTIRLGNGPFVGPLSVQVSGGGGKLDYSGALRDVYVNLQTGQATNLSSFSGIRDVTGGHGRNILVGDGQGNVLTGGPLLQNILIAGNGSGSDTLVGGGGEDILIGGFTAYDHNKSALDAIMAVWSSTRGLYADHVRQLKTGAGAPLLSARTVFGDHNVDTLTGNTGLDLFFATLRDRTDAGPREVTVSLPLGGLAGSVYLDANNNGRRDPCEKGIAGVTIELFREAPSGDVLVASTVTGSDGQFSFTDWPAGTYKLVEAPPAGYKDGKDRAGTLGGKVGHDVISDIVVLPGELGTNYQFGERRR